MMTAHTTTVHDDFTEVRLPGGRWYLVDHATGRLIPGVSGGGPDPDPAAPGGGAGGGAAAGAGAGAGAAGANGNGDGADALTPWDKVDFTGLNAKNLPKPLQDIMNGIAANNRRGLQEELASTKGQLETATAQQQEMQTQLATLNDAIEALKQPPEPGKAVDDPEYVPPALRKHPELALAYRDMRKEGLSAKQTATALEQQLKDVTKKFEESQNETKAEREKRAAVEKRNLEIRRDREALGILSALNVIDPRREYALYANRLEYDAETDSFKYRRGEELVDPTEGIKADLPDYVIRPEITNGGSGAQGGHGGAGAQKPETATDKKTRLSQEFASLKAKTAKGEKFSDADRVRMLQLGDELTELNSTK